MSVDKANKSKLSKLEEEILVNSVNDKCKNTYTRTFKHKLEFAGVNTAVSGTSLLLIYCITGADTSFNLVLFTYFVTFVIALVIAHCLPDDLVMDLIR